MMVKAMEQFILNLKEQKIFVSLNGDNLKIDFNGDSLPNDILMQLKENKLQIIDFLKKNQKKNVYQNIPALEKADRYASSSAQQRLWILSLLDEGGAYNMPNVLELDGTYQLDYFMHAIELVIDRHEILRTVFMEDENGLVKQLILTKEELGFTVEYKDFRAELNKEEKAKQYLEKDFYKPFDLKKGPLLRASIIQLSENQYIFYYNMHHIISDGWSLDVLSRDVFAFYEALKNNTEVGLAELRIQYKDYSAWQLSLLDEPSQAIHRDYWMDQLGGEIQALNLIRYKQRPPVRSSSGQRLAANIDQKTSDDLKQYCSTHGGSLFMGLLSVWNVLMYRYTGQSDIITGVPIAGREHTDLQDQIGFYLNTLALRNHVNSEECFEEIFEGVKASTLEGYAHQMYPFDRLVEELNVPRDMSRNAIFDFMLTLQNISEEELQDSKEEISFDQITNMGTSPSKFDINVTFQDRKTHLSIHVLYNPDVYDQELIENLIRHFKNLMKALLNAPKQAVGEVSYLSLQEESTLLNDFNATGLEYAKEKTIVDLFRGQVEKRADETAVVFENNVLSYKALDEQSNQLAHYLQENLHVKPGDLIGLQLERNQWMPVVMLAVLKSGGAYVPIAPDHPNERVKAIVADSGCKVVFDQQELARFITCLDEKDYPTSSPQIEVTSDNLAYVIYTSGSTGKPKGVMLEHGNVTNFFAGMTAIFGESAGVFLSMTNYTFDISVLEILWTLCSGYKLVVQGDAHDTEETEYSISKQIANHNVTHIQMTPSMGAILYEQLSKGTGWESLKNILLGGEPVPIGLVKGIYEALPTVAVYNMYGPTETTIWSTVKPLSRNLEEVTIGKPIANTHVYVLDEREHLLPVGVQGEIYIGGQGVARGYTNESLTAESFIESPFIKGDRLYKTGDYGSWLSDGSLQCFGRKDNQVKIRGHRIELGEIEEALLKKDTIKEAVAVLKGEDGQKQLVAYITSHSEETSAEMRSFLADFLPFYMIPNGYVQLDQLPLNGSGKVNRHALPNPEGLGLSSGVEYVLPRNELEEQLVKIWEELLQKDRIGIKDDFFVLGGHSLKATQLIVRVEENFGIKVDLKSVLSKPTIEGLAENINTLQWLQDKNQELNLDEEEIII
jgi:amino acid adenylation domain-containing protein